MSNKKTERESGVGKLGWHGDLTQNKIPKILDNFTGFVYKNIDRIGSPNFHELCQFTLCFDSHTPCFACAKIETVKSFSRTHKYKNKKKLVKSKTHVKSFFDSY